MKSLQGGSLALQDFVVGLGFLGRDPVDPEGAGQGLASLVRAFQAQAGGYLRRSGAVPGFQMLARVGDEGNLRLLRIRAQGLARQALEEGRVLLRPEDEGSLLAAPFEISPVESVALVLLRRGKGVQAFGDVERVALQGGVEILSRAVSRPRLEARLVELAAEVERREYRLFTINHVARVLGSVLEMEDLLQHLADMICEILTARSTMICLYQEEDGTLRSRCVKTLEGPAHLEFTVALSEAFLEWVRGFEGRTSPVVSGDDVQLQEMFPDLATELVRSDQVLFTPLVFKGRFLGLLAVGSRYTGGQYGQRDREFLSTLAPLASNALSNAHLYDLAIHDTTTGLYMGHYLRQRLREEVKRARRYGFPVSLIMVDLDHFKRVNDTLGHLAGDQVLRELAGVLAHDSRQDIDVVARYGGEEFVLLLPETPLPGALVVAERIRRGVMEHQFFGGRLRLTTSAGVASLPEDAVTWEQLLARADAELYRAKAAGRNCVFSRQS